MTWWMIVLAAVVYMSIGLAILVWVTDKREEMPGPAGTLFCMFLWPVLIITATSLFIGEQIVSYSKKRKKK